MGGDYQLNLARILIFTFFAFFRCPKYNFWYKNTQKSRFWGIFLHLKNNKNGHFKTYKALEGPKMDITHLWVGVSK